MQVNTSITVNEKYFGIKMAMINCDMNDPEVQESLYYLMVSKEEKVKTQAQAFDGKKNCWIPEPKEGYISAEIQSIKADNITVKTSKGDVLMLYFHL